MIPPVSVYLRIDGTTQHAYPLPCCGPREDVQQAIEGAPLNTSYSGVVNYAHLGSGEHSVGVEIRAEDCEPVIIEHTVTVATPGNVEFNTAFSFEEAWTGVDLLNDQILIVNATTWAEHPWSLFRVGRNATTGARHPWSLFRVGRTERGRSANLRVDYSVPTQNTGIVEAYSEDATTGDTLDAVQAIFNARCLSCHSSENDEGHPVAGLDLAEGNMPRNTIAARSGQLSDGTLLINPGRPDESYIVEKISMDALTLRQSYASGYAAVVNAEEIETIQHWVRSAEPSFRPVFASHDEDGDQDSEYDHDDDSDDDDDHG